MVRARTAEPEDKYQVWESKELVRQKRSNEAREMLTRVIKQVQPLMRRRRWRVKLVREFYPKNPSLLGLNVNRGVEIKLRMRHPGDCDSFFPFEHILGTMLHELCHNEIGPHNAAFYKLLDEITEEVERDMANGVFGTGVGFDGKSSGRLGGRGSVPLHNPDPRKLRERMLKAAELRAKQQKIMSVGPQRLGGSSDFARGLTPAQAAAKAAERRLKDDLWCPIEGLGDVLTGMDLNEAGEGEREGEREGQGQESRAEKKRRKDMAEMWKAMPRDMNARAGPSTSNTASASAVDLTHGPECTLGCCSQVIDLVTDSENEDVDEDKCDKKAEMWSCSVCTLDNEASAAACVVCGSAAPSAKSNKSKNINNKSSTGHAKRWTCKFCTLANPEECTHCKACETWRFSHGAPIASGVKWNQT